MYLGQRVAVITDPTQGTYDRYGRPVVRPPSTAMSVPVT
jgi:hypothetical protein